MNSWLRNNALLCVLLMAPSVWAATPVSNGQEVQDAIEKGDVEWLHELVEQRADVNATLPNGQYPIIFAAEQLSVGIMKVLTASNVDVLVRDVNGVNALHVAAAKGDVKKIKLLRAFKVPMNIQDDEGVTPLYYAWMKGKLKAADYMVESENARVNVNDKEGNPLAFRVVTLGDNPKIVEHMVKHKLNIFKRNKGDKSLLEVMNKRKYEKSAEILQHIYDAKLKAYQDKLNKRQAQ